MVIRILICLLLAGCAKTTVSPEFYATSWHSKDKPSGESYNQNNTGIGLSATQPVSEHWKLGVRGAQYRNSIDKTSRYAAATADYCIGAQFHTCIGAQAGAVTGYDKPLKPLLTPVIGLGYERVTLNLTAFPIQNRSGVAVSGWVSYRAFEF